MAESPYLDLDVTFNDALVRQTYDRRTTAAAAARKRGPLDPWRRVGDPAQPAFTAGWSNETLGAPNPAQFFVDEAGTVTLIGVVQSAPGTRGAIFRLPPDVCPANIELGVAAMVAQVDTGGGHLDTHSKLTEMVTISPSGDVTPGYSPDQWAAFDNADVAQALAAGTTTIPTTGFGGATITAGRKLDLFGAGASPNEIDFTVVAVNGNTLTVDRPLGYAHPLYPAASVQVYRFGADQLSYYQALVLGHRWRSALAGAPA